MFKNKKKALVLSVLTAIASVGFVVSASAAEETMNQDLAGITVEAERQATLPGGLIKSSGTVGIMGEKDVMDVPFQKTTLTQKAIDTFAANPSEASTAILVNVPAIRSAGSTLYNDYSIRGQNASAYQFRINGVPNMLSQTNIPMSMFEAVDVTSGASIGINGVTATESAGGTINLITKRAHDNSMKYTIGFSGHSTWTNLIDVSRRFGKNDENGLRINVGHIKGDTGISDENVKNDTFSLNYDRETENAKTNLFLGYRDTRTSEAQRYFYFGGKNISHMPAAPSAKNNYAFDGQTIGMKTYMATLNHEQKVDEKTKVFLNAGTAYNNGYDYLVPASSRLDVLNDAGDFSRNMNNEPFAIRNSYVQVGASHDWKLGAIENKTILAFDKDWYAAEWGVTDSSNRGVITGNLYNGNAVFNRISKNSKGPTFSGNTQYYGWSLINESKIGKAEVTLGAHRHVSKAQSSSHVVTRTDALAPMYGLVYRPTDRWALFANHTESFQAGKIIGNAYTNKGSILDPAKTKSNEVGVKYSTGKFLAGLSYFDMEKQADFEDANGNLTNKGELNYKGIELTLGGEIAPKWSLTGGLLYLDSEYNNNKTMEGKQVKGTSKMSGVANLQYAPDENSNIFARMVYTGKAPIYNGNNEELTISSSTVFDMGASYKTKINAVPVTFNATMFNVFNKDYWMPRPTYDFGILGNPRTFAVSATFEI